MLCSALRFERPLKAEVAGSNPVGATRKHEASPLCGWPFSSYRKPDGIERRGIAEFRKNDETKRATLSYKGIVKKRIVW